MTKKKGAPVRIKWALMDESWKAGVKSIRAIADDYQEAAGHKISPRGIKKHYDELGIPRDLTGKIRAKAESLVHKELVHELVHNSLKISESDIVNANAEQQSTIVLNERKDVTRFRNLAMSLMNELESQVTEKDYFKQLGEVLSDGDSGKMNDYFQKVIAFPGRNEGTKKLAETLKILIELERKVYKIDEIATEGTIEDFIRKGRGIA